MCILGQRVQRRVRTETEKRRDTGRHIQDVGGAGGRIQEEEWDPAVSSVVKEATTCHMEGRKTGNWAQFSASPGAGSQHIWEASCWGTYA